ncbi:hypothetical protein GCM10010869_71790 [Mesorhizobium tianshanense]|uniref:Uncharacterized protein n=1 Tax=Mesorhizobium tianshanense TaxID=39844 RepID=A0A562P581_9HYPH|nr:hypothetical protein [Mesorhizobium tianshanense]TWI39146.1 hypothetical protein IQ26_01995 [Mesorhizobium tianshanense]GLS41582.1 hypothetical protein GCM10010869_71790 [Mesorhizobium tianshanense]
MAALAQMAMMGTYAPSGLTSVTLLSTTTTATASINWPGNIQAGDVAVLIDIGISLSSTPPLSVTPAGFTNFMNAAISRTASARMMKSYRILDGGEAGTIVGIDGNILQGKLLYIFRPNAPVTAVLPMVWWNSQATSDNPAAQVVSASGQPGPLIVLGGAIGSSGGAMFSIASPAFDATQQFGDSGIGIGGYKIYNTSPADHTIDTGDQGTNILASGYLRFS